MNRRPSYTLASLLLLTVLLSVFLGLAVRAPEYGIVFAFLCVPALIRTIWLNGRRKAAGRGLDFNEKIVKFVTSLCLVIGVAAASAGTVAAIIGMAMQTPDPGGGIAFFATLFAVVAGGAVGIALLRRLWFPRDE